MKTATSESVLWTYELDLSTATIADIKVRNLAVVQKPLKINNSGQILVDAMYHYALYLIETCAAPDFGDPMHPGEDLTPPAIEAPEIEEPELDEIISFSPEGYPIIAAMISDGGSGVDWSSVLVYIDGWYAPAGVSDGHIICVFDHTLPVGIHKLEIYISDNNGNQAVYDTMFPYGDTDSFFGTIDHLRPQYYIANPDPEISAVISDFESWPNWKLLNCQINSQSAKFELETYYAPSQKIRILPNAAIEAHMYYYVEVFAVDGEDNPGYASWWFYYDDTLTVTNMTSDDFVATDTPDITAELSWAQPTIDVLLDGETAGWSNNGGIVSLYDPLTSLPFTLSDGMHTASVAGVSWTFGVDTTPPVFSLPRKNFMSNTVAGKITDALSGVNWDEVRVYFDEDDENGVTCEHLGDTFMAIAPVTLGEGWHKIKVYAEDNVGKFSTSGWIDFLVDLTDPDIGDHFPADNSYTYDLQPQIFLFCSDALSGINVIDSYMTIDGGDPIHRLPLHINNERAYYTPGELEPGSHTVYVRIYDRAGNWAEDTWDFNVAAPSAPSGQSLTVMIFPEYGTFPLTWTVRVWHNHAGATEITDDTENLILTWTPLLGTPSAAGRVYTIESALPGHYDITVNAVFTHNNDLLTKSASAPLDVPAPGGNAGHPPGAHAGEYGPADVEGGNAETDAQFCQPGAGAVQLTLTIYHGQNGSAADDEKGAVTVANLNDTNQDGIPDWDQDTVLNINDGFPPGRDEIDLMKLDCSIVDPNYNPAAVPPPPKGKLKIVQGKAKLWSSSSKVNCYETEVDVEPNVPSSPYLWVEARQASGSFGDIVLELTYNGSSKIVKATGIWFDVLGYNNDDYLRCQHQPLVGAFTNWTGGTLTGMINAPPNNPNNPTPRTWINAIEFSFQIRPSPPEWLASYGVKFDVTRRIESTAYTDTVEDTGNPGPKDFPEDKEQANDENAEATPDNDNDPEPADPRVYSIDTPALEAVIENDSTKKRLFVMNASEFVRLKTPGSGPFDRNTGDPGVVSGSICSPYLDWHSVIFLKHDGIDTPWSRFNPLPKTNGTFGGHLKPLRLPKLINALN